jgi:hypothetical protein
MRQLTAEHHRCFPPQATAGRQPPVRRRHATGSAVRAPVKALRFAPTPLRGAPTAALTVRASRRATFAVATADGWLAPAPGAATDDHGNRTTREGVTYLTGLICYLCPRLFRIHSGDEGRSRDLPSINAVVGAAS